MFKKLKDKITEEVKQSPLKSVQQLASAVVSPSSSSVFEPSSNDHFCIDDGDDDNQDTPKNSPAKSASGGFTTVSLQGQQSLVPEPLHSRRSSVSSVTSDSSSLFPRYEPSSVHFHVQSDLESASEIEDSAISNVQLERVSKENLFEAYRKLRLRYNKYKGRFVDLVEHYRRLEKENVKCKNILSETQDKALRRISELREQCNLEQEAKAHLEEALRSDLEEKDHLIATLNTKIELLKSRSEPEGSEEISAKSADIPAVNSDQIIEQFKEKVKKLEALLLKCKTSITEKNETIDRQQKEIESLKSENAEKLSMLTKDLTSAKSEIESLNNTVESLKRNEEEAALTLAENKLSVHQELETRDEQIKNLRTNIELINKEKDDLLNKVKSLESELKAAADLGRDRESDDEKAEFIQELARGKSEAVKLMQQKLITVEQSLTGKLKTKEIELEEVTKENGILKQKLFSIENKSFSSNSDIPNGSGDIVNDLIQIDCTSKLCKETLEKDKAKINTLETEILEKEKKLKSITDNHSLLIGKKELEIKELNDLKIKHSELQETNEASIKKYLDLENEMVVLKDNYKKESMRNEELSKQLQLLKENVNELNTEILHWQNLCSEKSNEIMKINDNNELLSESNERIIELEKLLSDKNFIVDSYSSKLKDLESLNNDLKLKLNNNYDIVKELQNNVNIITKDKHSLQEKIDSKSKEIDSLNDDIVKVNNVVKEREFKIVELEKVINNLKEEKASVVKKYEETLNSQDEKIETFKSEIKNNYLQVKQQLDECNSKIHFFESLVNCMKMVLSGSNVPDLNLLNNNNMFHELQNDGKFIISAINDLKASTINKETTIEQLSNDLEIANKSSENLKSEILNLNKLNDKQTLSRQTIEGKLNVQKMKIFEIKEFQNELRSQTELLINCVTNELISIKEETERLKRNCSLIESESSTKDKEKNNELENCKIRINMFEKQLQDRDNELKDYLLLKNKLDAVDSEKKILEQEKLHLENVITGLENEITSLKSTCDKLKENVNIEKNQCAELKTELYSVLEKLYTVSAVSDQKDYEKDNELQNYKKLINKMKKQLQDKNNKLEDYAKMKNQLDTVGSEKKIFEDEKLRLENAISTLENDVISLKSVCESLKENVESEKSRCMEIETELKTVTEKFNKESAKFDQLKNEICIKERDYKIALEAKDREVSSLIDELVIKDNKFEEELGKKDKEIDDLISKLKKSEEIQNDLSVNKDSELIRMKEESSANEKKLLNEVDVKNNRVGELEKILNMKDNEIKALKESLNRITCDKQTLENKTLVLKEETDKLKNELNTVNQRIEEKDFVVNNLEKKCIEMKNKLETITSKHNDELKLIKENHDQLLSNEIMKTHNESLNELEHLKNSLSVAENKNVDLLSKFNELQVTINRLREECETLKLREIDHVKEIKNLTEKLEAYSLGNNELNNFDGNKNLKTILKENEDLQFKFKDLEEKQAEKIKELIFDFNLKLSQKDEEIKSIESYNFDRKQEAEDFIVMELKQQIKDLQHELETRGDAFEKLLEEHKNEKKNSDSALEELKKQHDTQLREHDKKWRACLDRRLAETETKYKEEIDALSSEWKCERKFVSESSKEVVDKDEELECSNRLAVAAMESGVNSMELLRKQVTALTHQLDDAKQQHKREVNELQRLLVLKRHTKKASKNDDITVEDCTEMEYLRNILYEYMMGKEPVVLAKVLSAIVKFDAEQTNKVIQKEEQKVSLLGIGI